MDRQPFDRFYQSRAWRKCRAAYIAEHGGLCERCLARGLIVPGTEVHHRIRLTPDTLDDPAIALNHDNLELLCKDCHLSEHERPTNRRYRVNERGEVEILPVMPG